MSPVWRCRAGLHAWRRPQWQWSLVGAGLGWRRIRRCRACPKVGHLGWLYGVQTMNTDGSR